MAAIDAEIRKYVSLMGNEQKKSLLDTIKSWLHIPTSNKGGDSGKRNSAIDYSQYNFPASAIKFNRDEINGR